MRQKHGGNRGAQGLKEYAKLLIRAALAEDIGEGDITTRAIVSPSARGHAVLLAKEDFVVAGLFVAKEVFKTLDPGTSFRAHFKDGCRVKKGETLAEIEGRMDVLLSGERVALNFLQRLSGIATLTSRFVREIKGTKAKVLDTRKTTPCLRPLEKYAVKAGGGQNHRAGLFDSVLIKDNHIKAAGGVGRALEMVAKKYGGLVRVEVEVTNLDELNEAIGFKPDIIMLDNMDAAVMKKAVRMVNKRSLIEASGGITLENIAKAARTGVDFISVGGLTHSAKAVDISMEVVSYALKRERRG